ncbi:Jouberin [Halotydeus destructor]|nr:Jouberin [Halotydeus destructor]
MSNQQNSESANGSNSSNGDLERPKAKPRLSRQAASVQSEAIELNALSEPNVHKGPKKPPKLTRIKSEPSSSKSQSTDESGHLTNWTLSRKDSQNSTGTVEFIASENNGPLDETSRSTKLELTNSSVELAPLASAEIMDDSAPVDRTGKQCDTGNNDEQASSRAEDVESNRKSSLVVPEKGKGFLLKKLMKFPLTLRRSKSEDRPERVPLDSSETSSNPATRSTNSETTILDPIAEDTGSNSSSEKFDNVLGLHIHSVDKKLKCNKLVFHPVVKVHIIDTATGRYLAKKNCQRTVVSYYENSSENVNYVLPAMTQPCDLVTKIRYPRFPIWEELLLYNDDYNHFVKDGVLFLFEILDFMTFESKSGTGKGQNWGFYRIAWAFLRPVGVTGRRHLDRKCRLQLYTPVSAKLSRDADNTTEEERGATSDGQSLRQVKTIAVRPELDTSPAASPPLWSRPTGHPCKVPKSKWQEFSAGNNRSCYSLRFSNEGTKLACGASVFAAYLSAEKRSSVFIYELPSGDFFKRVHGFHLGTIYDIDWSCDDKLIMSASNDCTAQVWPVAIDKGNNSASGVILPHPCFIYSCRFHPSQSTIIFTGAFDGVIRIWSVRHCFHLDGSPHNQPHHNQRHHLSNGHLHHQSTLSHAGAREPELLREIDGHQGQILDLAFKIEPMQGRPDRLTLFSAGSNGSLILWQSRIEQFNDQSIWLPVARVRIPELKGIPINSIQVCPVGSKLFLCCRDGVLRMIDYKTEIVVQKYPGSFNFNHLIRGSLSPCGRLVFVGSEDGYVHAWDSESGECIHTFDKLPFKGPVTCVQYHPFDHILAMCGLGGRTVSVSLYKHHYQFSPVRSPLISHPTPPFLRPSRAANAKGHRLQKSFTVDPGHGNQSTAVTVAPLSSSNNVEPLVPSRMKKAIKKIEVALKMRSLEQS